jgi:hypothetical protein
MMQDSQDPIFLLKVLLGKRKNFSESYKHLSTLALKKVRLRWPNS